MKYGDAEIYLIQLCDCKSKMELERCERSHIESIECVNKTIPGRTLKEYYIDNKDNLKKQSKQYRIDNKDKIKKQKKQYYINNEDKIKNNQKQYRIDNKITCDICNKLIYKNYLKKHQKTQSCKSYICIFLDE